MPDYEIEHAAFGQGYRWVCGVDEAGRGPLAGPVYAAAVILPRDLYIEGLDDSKKLSAKKREALYDTICEKSVAYAIASIDEKEIDRINILNATMHAMKLAVEKLKPLPDYVLIDGNKAPEELGFPCETVIKGDAKSMSIAAASILAKVARDRFMVQISERYPQYNFSKHKGYGTREHLTLIHGYGPCEIHRQSFLKKII